MTDDDSILYADLDTLNRLTITGRTRTISFDGGTAAAFPDTDPIYPGVKLMLSDQVFGNAVHRKSWIVDESRHVFEYVGDV